MAPRPREGTMQQPWEPGPQPAAAPTSSKPTHKLSGSLQERAAAGSLAQPGRPNERFLEEEA